MFPIEPSEWTIAFHRRSVHRWVNWLAVGRYKHVSAFAYVRSLKLWLFYDIELTGTRLGIVPDDDEGCRWMAEHISGAELIWFKKPIGGSFLGGIGRRFSCVSAVAHLVGARGALLTPTALWRYCLANGGEVVNGTGGSSTSTDPGRAGAG